MGIGDDDVGQGLDVTEPVGYPKAVSVQPRRTLLWFVAPCGQLEPAVIGRVDQTGLGQGPPKESQSPQAYRPGFAADPSTAGWSAERKGGGGQG